MQVPESHKNVNICLPDNIAGHLSTLQYKLISNCLAGLPSSVEQCAILKILFRTHLEDVISSTPTWPHT